MLELVVGCAAAATPHSIWRMFRVWTDERYLFGIMHLKCLCVGFVGECCRVDVSSWNLEKKFSSGGFLYQRIFKQCCRFEDINVFSSHPLMSFTFQPPNQNEWKATTGKLSSCSILFPRVICSNSNWFSLFEWTNFISFREFSLLFVPTRRVIWAQNGVSFFIVLMFEWFSG